MSIEQRLKELRLTLPPVGGALGNYVHAKRVGNLLFFRARGRRTAPTAKCRKASSAPACRSTRGIGTRAVSGPPMNFTSTAAGGEGISPGIEDVSLVLHQGEILGVAGVDGNGQRELAETIAGIRQQTEGEVRVGGGAGRLSSASVTSGAYDKCAPNNEAKRRHAPKFAATHTHSLQGTGLAKDLAERAGHDDSTDRKLSRFIGCWFE